MILLPVNKEDGSRQATDSRRQMILGSKVSSLTHALKSMLFSVYSVVLRDSAALSCPSSPLCHSAFWF